MNPPSSLLDEYEDDEVIYVPTPVENVEGETNIDAGGGRPAATAGLRSYLFYREWADSVSLQLPQNCVLSQAIDELVAQGHGLAGHVSCAHYTTMVADDDGDPDDDMPEIGADSILKTLNVKAFYVSPKADAVTADVLSPATGKRDPALPTTLPPGVAGFVHCLHLEWREGAPLSVALEAGASVTDLIRTLVVGECALPRRTRATSYLVSIADDEGLPDEDLPALSHNSHLKDFMGYGAGFHLAPHGDEDPEGTGIEETDEVPVANTFRLVVPWEVPTSSEDTGPQGWGLSSQGPNLTAHATPGETVSAMIARVATGERGHNRAKYRMQQFGSPEPQGVPGDTDVSSLDPSVAYVLVEDGTGALDTRSCLDTALIQLPWVALSAEDATAAGGSAHGRFVWRGREETNPSSGRLGTGEGAASRVQAVRACPDTRVKALVDAIATFHLLPVEKCSLCRNGGLSPLPMEAPLYSLGCPELVFDFLIDEETWRASVDAIQEREKEEVASTPSSTLGTRAGSIHQGALRSDSMHNLLLLSDSSTVEVQEEYRVVCGEGRQASQCTLLIDTHQVTTQKLSRDSENPWYQFAASIETADTQPISAIRSVAVEGDPEEAKFCIVFRPDRAVTYTVMGAADAEAGRPQAHAAMQKRDEIVLKLLKLLQAEHGGQNMEWQCMMRNPRGRPQPRIVGVDRSNFYNYEPQKKGLSQMLGFASGPKRDSRKLLHLKSIEFHPSLTTVFTVVFNEGSELETSEDIATVYEASSAEECESIVAHIRKLADVARAQHEVDTRSRIRSGSQCKRRASV